MAVLSSFPPLLLRAKWDGIGTRLCIMHSIITRAEGTLVFIRACGITSVGPIFQKQKQRLAMCQVTINMLSDHHRYEVEHLLGLKKE